MPPQLLWSRSLEGEQPGLLLGEDRILLHCTTGDGSTKGIEMFCYDLEGHRVWSRAGWEGLLTLPKNRFLVTSGVPLVIDSDGQVLNSADIRGVTQAVRHGDVLLLAGAEEVYASDLQLRLLWQARWPRRRLSLRDGFSAGMFWWVDENRLWRWAPHGHPEIFGQLPLDLIAEAMDEYERLTDRSALAGWYFNRESPEGAAFQRGDRPWTFYWRIAFDETRERLFLANAMLPHLILCLDRSGQPLWCKYLSCGCCGGVPYALPNGLYVASSGCGGTLTWLDRDGRLIVQSLPHEGVGLATAYSNEVWVLADGRCLVDGGPGIVAYGPTGERLWIFPHQCFLRFHCDSAGQTLAACYWHKNERNDSPLTVLELASNL